MEIKPVSSVINEVERNLEQLISSVLDRGFDDVSLNFDDYSLLLSQYEFRKLIVYELYEAYFPPRRHEFEIKIISEIVDAIAKARAVDFVAAAVVSGMLGNLAYDIAKQLLLNVKARLGQQHKRFSAFSEIIKDIEAIQKFFAGRKEADFQDIVTSLNIPPDRVLPLLKMLGFKCKRRKKRQIWMC